MNLEINKDQFLKILIYILPAALISGPLISDGIVIIISLFVINEIITRKKYFLFKNKIILLFLLFVFILCISSFLSDNPMVSLKSSFLYIRFGLFILGTIYILENVDKNFYKFFFLYYFYYHNLFIIFCHNRVLLYRFTIYGSSKSRF